MGLVILILGLAVFIGAHVFVTQRDARAAAIVRLGEGPYKGLFSLVSLIGIVLIVWGFARYRAAARVCRIRPFYLDGACADLELLP